MDWPPSQALARQNSWSRRVDAIEEVLGGVISRRTGKRQGVKV